MILIKQGKDIVLCFLKRLFMMQSEEADEPVQVFRLAVEIGSSFWAPALNTHSSLKYPRSLVLTLPAILTASMNGSISSSLPEPKAQGLTLSPVYTYK